MDQLGLAYCVVLFALDGVVVVLSGNYVLFASRVFFVADYGQFSYPFLCE